MNPAYPVSAVVNQEDGILALTILQINPACKSLLLIGGTGSGKSRLMESWRDLIGSSGFVSLPKGMSREDLFGSMDMETLLATGEQRLSPGLLLRGDQKTLLLEDVNLWSRDQLSILQRAQEIGEHTAQLRENRAVAPLNYRLIASMNPSDGLLSYSQLSDFTMSYVLETAKNWEERTAVIKSNLRHVEGDELFLQEFYDADAHYLAKIRDAKMRLPKIVVSRENANAAHALLEAVGIRRNDIGVRLLQVARALAALRASPTVDLIDLEQAGRFVLPHLIRMDAPVKVERPRTPTPRESNREEPPKAFEGDGESKDESESSSYRREDEDRVEAIAEQFADLSLQMQQVFLEGIAPQGKRGEAKSPFGNGKMVESVRWQSEYGSNIAFGATLREAALHQKYRKSAMAITIFIEDLHSKVRNQKAASTVLFVVDASGSMGAQRRMGSVKAVVLSLLEDGYRNRDEVGILIFRKRGAQLLLPPTRSPYLARKLLESLPTGGKTPLAAGLSSAYQLLQARRVKNQQEAQILVLLSDGKGNVPIRLDPMEDARQMAYQIAKSPIQTVVFDTETSFIQYGYAKELAEIMNSGYMKLESITQSEISKVIKTRM